MNIAKTVCCFLLLLNITSCGGSGQTQGGSVVQTPDSSGHSDSSKSGAPDSGFGNGGIVTTKFGSSTNVLTNLLIQPDDRVVVTGTFSNGSRSEYALARFLPDGSPDNGFGVGGKITILPCINGGEVGGSALAPDGSIVVVGTTHNGANNDIDIVRIRENGTQDTSWGNPGRLLSSAETNEVGYGIAVQRDGKIVVVGSVANGANSDFLVSRFNSDGTLDKTFGSGGVVKTPFTANTASNRYAVAQHAAVTPDGRIIVAGTLALVNGKNLSYGGAVVCYLGSGEIDTSFGTSGFITNAPGFLSGFLFQRDGKICLAMYQGSSTSYQIYRYTAGGASDTGFGVNGVVFTNLPVDILSLAEDALGRILASGQSQAGYAISLIRFRSDGILDTSFGTSGTATTRLSDYDAGMAVAVQRDGKIVVGGMTGNTPAASSFVMVRYTP